MNTRLKIAIYKNRAEKSKKLIFPRRESHFCIIIWHRKRWPYDDDSWRDSFRPGISCTKWTPHFECRKVKKWLFDQNWRKSCEITVFLIFKWFERPAGAENEISWHLRRTKKVIFHWKSVYFLENRCFEQIVKLCVSYKDFHTFCPLRDRCCCWPRRQKVLEILVF